MEQYTVLSKKAYEFATFPTLTAQEAARWVESEGSFRTLPEKLLSFCPGAMEEMKAQIRTGLCRNHPSGKEQESIRKNVNNWFTRKEGMDDRTISRNYAIEICFILKLSLDRADQFLRAVNGEGIHYRNLGEFILGYALKQQMTYEEYLDLRRELEALAEALPKESQGEENYTRSSELALKELGTEEALGEYIREHAGDFSSSHNTSYAYFMDMLDALQNGGTNASVEELVTQNLYRRFLKKSRGLTPIAKSIRSGWPDESYISKMKNRELAVTRKVLILLYLASGGEVIREYSWDENSLDAFLLSDDALEDGMDNEDFEGLKNQIDAMLVECGFAALDPRAPFDWMVLFAIATGDLFDLDDRFSEFLTALFGNEMKE